MFATNDFECERSRPSLTRMATPDKVGIEHQHVLLYALWSYGERCLSVVELLNSTKPLCWAEVDQSAHHEKNDTILDLLYRAISYPLMIQ